MLAQPSFTHPCTKQLDSECARYVYYVVYQAQPFSTHLCTKQLDSMNLNVPGMVWMCQVWLTCTQVVSALLMVTWYYVTSCLLVLSTHMVRPATWLSFWYDSLEKWAGDVDCEIFSPKTCLSFLEGAIEDRLPKNTTCKAYTDKGCSTA